MSKIVQLSPTGVSMSKRTASYDDRLVVIEEVAPLQMTLRDGITLNDCHLYSTAVCLLLTNL